MAGAEAGPVAVLIPVFNEEPVIAGTIAAVRAAGFAASDIYVVDDRSTDRSAAIARGLGVQVFTVPANGGKARAQGAALRHYRLLDRYDWLVFLDGDTLVDRGFLAQMRQAARHHPEAGLLVGEVRSLPDRHLYSAARANEYAYGQDIVKMGQSRFNVVFVSPGCASMYRTGLLRRLHIDPGTLAEDMDLTLQVHRAGGRVVFVPRAIVHTQDPATFADYHRQVLRWYRGFWQVVAKHRIFGLARKRPVDLYMMFLVLDALLFNRFAWWGAALATASGFPWWMVAGDLGLAGLVALYAACRTRRADVLLKFPLYYWLLFVNGYVFLRAFVEVVVLRRRLLAWNKVRRYELTL